MRLFPLLHRIKVKVNTEQGLCCVVTTEAKNVVPLLKGSIIDERGGMPGGAVHIHDSEKARN